MTAMNNDERLTTILKQADAVIRSEHDEDNLSELIDGTIVWVLNNYLPFSRWWAGLYAASKNPDTWTEDGDRVTIGHVLNAMHMQSDIVA